MLTKKQQDLVQEHVYIVDWVIRKYIMVNESVQGLGWDDLHQSGCVALCEAAQKFDGRCQFSTFAYMVVKNRLIDECRKIKVRQRRQCSLENPNPNTGDESSYLDTIAAPEEPDALGQKFISWQFSSLKQRHTGVTLKGIEALELRYLGYSGTDIAALYQVPPKHVFAWISRAKKKLKASGELEALLNCCK